MTFAVAFSAQFASRASDAATGDSEGRRRIERLEVLVLVQGHDEQAFPNAADKQHGLLSAHSMFAGIRVNVE